MFKQDEIDELKKQLGSDGKLIISDNLTEKQKERYQFINSLNIDLISVLTRNPKSIDLDDEDSTPVVDSDDLIDDTDVEVLDNDNNIEEDDDDDDAGVEELNDFF